MTAGDDIAFVLAAPPGTDKEVARVVNQYHLTVPVYILAGERSPVYRTVSLPVSFIIAPDGRICFQHEGPARWDDDTTADFLRKLTPTRKY